MLEYDYQKRIPIQNCLKHSYFDNMDEIFLQLKKDGYIEVELINELFESWKRARKVTKVTKKPKSEPQTKFQLKQR